MERENLLGGAGSAATRLPADPEAAEALSAAEAAGAAAAGEALGAAEAAGAGDAELKDVAGRFPAFSAAWAALAERAYRRGDAVTAYAFARTGYHRGLDQLRRAGWRGTGPVPWEHEPNRGFLRSLHMLGKAAHQIGEQDEAERCAQFLYDSSPTAAAELNAGDLGAVVEYFVAMTTEVPPGAEVDDVRAREAANTSRLIAEGHIKRLWRPPLRPGEWRTLGLFAAADDAELERILASMPLRVWRTDDVTPLSQHPFDPDPPTRAIKDAAEFLTRFTLTIPDGVPDEAVDTRIAAEGARARELSGAGHLIRLWALPPGPGKPNTLGLWRAKDPVEMQAILDALPLAEWLSAEVTPLSPHPSDPGLGGTYPPKRLPAGPPGKLTAQEPLPRLRRAGASDFYPRGVTTAMPAIVLVGAQWGDEGKGKATDLLGDRVHYVVRYQGGNNAGHTVVIGDESYALHMLPSGVLSENVTPVIGNGVVIDPEVLLDEIDTLQARNVSCDKLLVSANAHLIMPYHGALDKVTERYLGSNRIGTTGRGIGPAYGDKIARVGIRVQDLFDPGILRQKLDLVLRDKNQILTKVYNRRAIEPSKIAQDYEKYAERLRPYVADTSLVLGKALDEGKVVLLEGAQATMLDVDHGTYPFVTSSSPTAGGACAGSGIGPTRITKVIGIVKAYTTRVGEGPFPTELLDDNGEWLRKTGMEYGVTTGRPRRCGWFDAVIARYAARVNGVTDFFLTKLDVLSTLSKVPICVAYEVDGTRYDEIPMTQTGFHHATPVYEYFDGWWEDISGARDFADLPANAKAYVRAIEEMIGAPVAGIGVGPRRDQTLQLRDLLR